MSDEQQLAFLEKESKKGLMHVAEAITKMHREYITLQMLERGYRPSGFLIASGLVEKERDEDGFPVANKKLLSALNQFLKMGNRLTTEYGKILRHAMDEMGIDYLHSPTYPLDPLEENAV